MGQVDDSRRQPWFLRTAPAAGPLLYSPSVIGADSRSGYDSIDSFRHSLATVAPTRRINITAIVALVCAFLFAPAGVILGYLARRQIARTGGSGGGLATAALFISSMFIAIPVVLYLTVALVLIGADAVTAHDLQPSSATVATAP